MKAKLYSPQGESKGEISLPPLFNTKPRQDMVKKYFEVEKLSQPYSPDPKAGKKHSASGTISHKRHDWKGHYGQGVSRIPRKTMWRRGTNFFWIGAEISSTRGGRRAHPPKGIGKEKKINKKEITLAFNSALAATASQELITSRYSSLDKSPEAPIVIESLPNKSKDMLSALKKIFSSSEHLIQKQKSIRAGKGKSRGRKYKISQGLLIVKGDKEEAKSSTLNIKPLSELRISDLYPLGRLTLYTKQALIELEGEKEK